jgi:hypothetical protein
MSAFIDCMVCRARVIVPDSDSMSDADVAAYLESVGCTVAPTRCAEHAGADGLAKVLAGLESKTACTDEHDPDPWLRYVGIAMAQVTFGAGGPQSGRPKLAPRVEFCQEPAHYWLYDSFTVPEDKLAAAEPALVVEAAPVTTETCRLCLGSGRIAVGRAGVNPPKKTCPACEGKRILPLDHDYHDDTI